jgi:hypothetical protein
LYLRANHKSVLGIGCYADEHGATFACVDEEGMEQWLSGNSSSSSGAHQSDLGTGNDRRGSNAALVTPAAAAAGGRRVTFSLVGYPPKDNYEGRLYPLEWIDKVSSRQDKTGTFSCSCPMVGHAVALAVVLAGNFDSLDVTVSCIMSWRVVALCSCSAVQPLPPDWCVVHSTPSKRVPSHLMHLGCVQKYTGCCHIAVPMVVMTSGMTL